VTQASFEIVKSLRCQAFDDGTNVLLVDFRISCDSERYKAMTAYCTAMFLVFPIGIPLFTLRALYVHRNSIFPKNEGRYLRVRRV
jgi:hypothetical protein